MAALNQKPDGVSIEIVMIKNTRTRVIDMLLVSGKLFDTRPQLSSRWDLQLSVRGKVKESEQRV